MKVVMVEPKKPAYITEIGNDLESMKKAVGGYIEPIYYLDNPVRSWSETRKRRLLDLRETAVSATGLLRVRFLFAVNVTKTFVLCPTICAKSTLRHLLSRRILPRMKFNRIWAVLFLAGRKLKPLKRL